MAGDRYSDEIEVESRRSATPAYVAILLGCLGVALADIFLPTGVGASMAYTVVVVFAALTGGYRSVWLAAGVASLLTVVVYALSSGGAATWIVVANRALSLTGIWAVAIPVLLTSPSSPSASTPGHFRLAPLLLALPALFVVPIIAGLNSTAITEANTSAMVDRRAAAIERLLGEIGRLDEVLTMSAVAASQSGDGRWLERYNAHVPLLDATLDQLLEQVPPDQRGNVEATVTANSTLIALEEQAFALLAAGDAQGALVVLSHESYISEKLAYKTGMAALRQDVLARTEQLASQDANRLIARRHLINIGSLTLTLMWTLATLMLLRTSRRHARANRRLKAQKRALTQSNRELEQFAYVASHDMQEPLRMVVEFAKRLKADPDSKLTVRGTTYLRFVTEGAERMRRLVADLLTYARLDAVVTHSRVPLDNVLANVIVDLTAAIEESEAKVHCAPLPVIDGDHTRLRQLFLNLISNAIKFRSDATPVIHVECRIIADTCEITVRDNGIGIEPKYHDRIFQMFQRLHASDEYTGTGIGLALCQKIVHQHQGRLWIDASVVDGASFKLSFPLRSSATLEIS